MQEKRSSLNTLKNLKIKKHKKINKIFYSLFNWNDIIKNSLVILYKKEIIKKNFEIIYNFNYFARKDIYNLKKYNIYNINSTRKNCLEKICPLCAKYIKICKGHLGCFKLEIPIYNNFFKFEFINVLKCLCFNCYLCKFNRDILKNILGKNIHSTLQIKYNVYQKYLSLACFNKVCCSCYKKEKIIILSFKKYKYFSENQNIVIKNLSQDTKFKLQKIITKEYLAIHFLKSFENLINDQEKLLNIGCKLKNIIFYFFPISSIFIRTSFKYQNLFIENKINIYYKKIITLNIKIHFLKKKKTYSIISMLNCLSKIQNFCTLLICETTEKKKLNFQINTTTKNGVLNRLIGKKGRIRNTILSKRVDFSSRSVISPDPKTSINSISLSLFSCKKLTFPIKITKYNFNAITNKYFDMKKKYFLIKYMTNLDIKKKFSPQFLQIKQIKKKLKNNIIFEREILENDLVLFNRQPSLHRFSILSLLLKTQNSKTFSFNPILCSPFNADFDGDEMNIHLLQDIETKTEALKIMTPFVNFNLNSNPYLLFFPIQDQVYIYYLKTNKKNLFNPSILKTFSLKFFDKKFFQLKRYFFKKKKKILFSTLKNNIHSNYFSNKINLFNKNEVTKFFYNHYLSGVLPKTQFINKNIGLANILSKFEGKFYYQLLISEMNREITERPVYFSNTLGIDNVLYQQKNIKYIYISNNAIETFFNNIMDFYNKKIILNFKKKTKYSIIQQLINFYQKTQKLSFNLSFINSIYLDNLRLINTSGSKGTKTNLLAIKLRVGFQSLIFKNQTYSFMNILFPFHLYNSQSLAYNNIVPDSFTKGLGKGSFFAHVSAGREAVIESSIKASETGYLARKLQMSICDIFLHYDFSIRNNIGAYLSSIIYKKTNTNHIGLLSSENHLYYRFLNKQCLDYHIINRNSNKLYKYFNEIILTSDTYFYFNLNLKYWKIYKNFFTSISNFFQFSFSLIVIYNYLYYEVNILEKTKTCCQNICLTNYVNDCYFYSIFKLFIFEKIKNLEIPGTPFGLRSAQSLTEPCTQMTLKTFHFTGSMINDIHKAFIKIRNLLNVIKNSKNNSYFITIHNNKIHTTEKNLVTFKRNIKNLKHTRKLKSIHIKYNNRNTFTQLETIKIEIIISNNMNYTNSLKLSNVLIDVLKKKNYKHSKITFFNNNLKISSNTKHTFTLYSKFLFILSKIEYNQNLNKIKIFLKNKLKNFMKYYKILITLSPNNRIFHGLYNSIPTCFKIIVSNNIYYIFKTFGIEASRLLIYETLLKITTKQKIKIKKNYVDLISDYLTYDAKLNGISLTKQFRKKISSLQLASLEKTLYILKKSTFIGNIDYIKGFIENIFSGNQVSFGTGIFKIIF
uniref:DNA-directed RNA polymerase n=1 Tax=Lotharella vacuolata TaxID=74820 RepID=A0A0H5BK13_9EUKA|nr:DNA-directed RNA polymerase III largest subunit [Lotharella vacuolata]